MLVNIQQPVIQSDGTLLLATDSKVQLQSCDAVKCNERYIKCINRH